MARRIGFDVGASFRKGTKRLGAHPGVWLLTAVFSLLVFGICYLAPILPIWAAAILLATVPGVVLSVLEGLYLMIHTAHEPTLSSVRRALAPTSWFRSALALNTCLVLIVGGAALAILVVTMGFSFGALSSSSRGPTSSDWLQAARILLAAMLVPATLVGAGLLFAPLHVIQHGVGSFTALRRSWETTYGSRIRLAYLSAPAAICVAVFVLFLLPGRHGSGHLVSAADVVFALICSLLVIPWSLSAGIASHVQLQRARFQSRRESWFGDSEQIGFPER